MYHPDSGASDPMYSCAVSDGLYSTFVIYTVSDGGLTMRRADADADGARVDGMNGADVDGVRETLAGSGD